MEKTTSKKSARAATETPITPERERTPHELLAMLEPAESRHEMAQQMRRLFSAEERLQVLRSGLAYPMVLCGPGVEKA